MLDFTGRPLSRKVMATGVSPSMEYVACGGVKGSPAGITPYQLRETPKSRDDKAV